MTTRLGRLRSVGVKQFVDNYLLFQMRATGMMANDEVCDILIEQGVSKNDAGAMRRIGSAVKLINDGDAKWALEYCSAPERRVDVEIKRKAAELVRTGAYK